MTSPIDKLTPAERKLVDQNRAYWSNDALSIIDRLAPQPKPLDPIEKLIMLWKDRASEGRPYSWWGQAVDELTTARMEQKKEK